MAKTAKRSTRKTAKKAVAKKSVAKALTKTKPAATPPAFVGFDPKAYGFWHELAAEMNKAWFDDNKDRYQTTWVEPTTALLARVAAGLASAYRPMKLGVPKVMRIHRDVRFSKDKSPYKTHIGAVLTVASKRLQEGGNAAFYLHLGRDEEFVGVGCYQFDSKKLAKWRKQVAGKPGVELAKIVAKLRAAGYQVGGHDDLVKVPKPYPADHPRADLLRMKGLTGGMPAIPKGMVHKPAFATWLVEHARAMAPLVKWLEKHVG